MARLARRRARPAAPLPGDPVNLRGFPCLIGLYLEALAVRNFSAGTLRSLHYQLGWFARWADERGLSEPAQVTRPMLESYQRWLYYYRKKSGQPLTFHTQFQRLSALRGFFRWLTRQNRILSNPASDLDAPRLPHRLPRAVLSVAEVEQVLALPDLGDPFGLRDRAMLEVLYSTGMRRAELLALKFSDVDAERLTIFIREGKGKKDRVIPVGERALIWLDRYLTAARPQIVTAPDEGVIFLTFLGQPFNPTAFSKIVRDYVDRAQLDKTGSCHLFRHTMATLMLDGGADIRFIQEMLGHTHLSSTELYTHVSIRKLQAIHAATHPGARMTPPELAAPPEPGKPDPASAEEDHAERRAALLTALGDEADEEAAD
ncbi:MAG: site-specific tyrosine recombinase XerC [Candidatus Wallbacteria bacterium]|nr:site-specific tyrosine recombinase XerC [Candidatus Wallbacteria bacterium]